MDPQKDASYKWIIKELIRKLHVILGPNVTLFKILAIQGISTDSQGRISISDQISSLEIFKKIIEQFSFLSRTVLYQIANTIIANPDLKAVSKEEINKTIDNVFVKETNSVLTEHNLNKSISDDMLALNNGLQAVLYTDHKDNNQEEISSSQPSASTLPSALDSNKVEEVEKIFADATQKGRD